MSKTNLQWKWYWTVGAYLIEYDFYKKNQKGQGHNQLYKCGLHRNKNWTVGTYLIGCGLWQKPNNTTTWLIICVAYDENEIELSNLSNWVWYITKTKKDNDMNDRTCTVYTENDTELSWLIRPGAVYDENQIR